VNLEIFFPKELLGLPPQREIDFEIELVSDAQPILKASYCTALTEPSELKIQSDELLQKGFIKPSVPS